MSEFCTPQAFLTCNQLVTEYTYEVEMQRKDCGDAAEAVRKDCGDAAEAVRKDYGISADIARIKCGANACGPAADATSECTPGPP